MKGNCKPNFAIQSAAVPAEEMVEDDDEEESVDSCNWLHLYLVDVFFDHVSISCREVRRALVDNTRSKTAIYCFLFSKTKTSIFLNIKTIAAAWGSGANGSDAVCSRTVMVCEGRERKLSINDKCFFFSKFSNFAGKTTILSLQQEIYFGHASLMEMSNGKLGMRMVVHLPLMRNVAGWCDMQFSEHQCVSFSNTDVYQNFNDILTYCVDETLNIRTLFMDEDLYRHQLSTPSKLRANKPPALINLMERIVMSWCRVTNEVLRQIQELIPENQYAKQDVENRHWCNIITLVKPLYNHLSSQKFMALVRCLYYAGSDLQEWKLMTEKVTQCYNKAIGNLWFMITIKMLFMTIMLNDQLPSQCQRISSLCTYIYSMYRSMSPNLNIDSFHLKVVKGGCCDIACEDLGRFVWQEFVHKNHGNYPGCSWMHLEHVLEFTIQKLAFPLCKRSPCALLNMHIKMQRAQNTTIHMLAIRNVAKPGTSSGAQLSEVSLEGTESEEEPVASSSGSSASSLDPPPALETVQIEAGGADATTIPNPQGDHMKSLERKNVLEPEVEVIVDEEEPKENDELKKDGGDDFSVGNGF